MLCYFGASGSFDSANERYQSAIRPLLQKMSRDQFISLIATVNENKQIHNRNASYLTNTEIATTAIDLLGIDFNFSAYPKFKFDETEAFQKNRDEKKDETSAVELPF